MRNSPTGYNLTDSNDNQDDSNNMFGLDGAGGSPSGLPGNNGPSGLNSLDSNRSRNGGWSFNFKIKERLFLFSFDLIEMNSFYNYLIYCIFLIADFIFIAYYPANQIYADFVIPQKNKQTYSITRDALVKSASMPMKRPSTYGGLNEVLSDLSSQYYDLEPTGLYTEEVKYEKRFVGENRDTIVSQILSYLNIDYILDNLNFEDFVGVQSYFCHGLLALYFLFAIMVITRQPGTISLTGQRRFLTKLSCFLVVTLAKTLQLPFITFLLKIFACSNHEIYLDRLTAERDSLVAKAKSLVGSTSGSGNTGSSMISTIYEDYCYIDVHRSQVVYTAIILVLYYSLVSYFHYFLTLSYPHEKLPWACLPTKVPIIREITKFAIVFSYQETNISQNGLSYLNILFTLLWLFILYKRIKHVLIFHTSVYYITIVGESVLFVIFLFASLRDFVSIDRNFVLHALLVGSCIFMSYTVLLFREKVRQESLSRVDFALYEKDFDALIMMFTLHELIERSGYDEAQDFLLRGFIERHIEICEFPACSCIKYYAICNQNYRLELAQMSPFSRVYDSNQINSQANLANMQSRVGNGQSMVMQHTMNNYTGRDPQSDGDELSTLKTFYGGGKKNQQKQNKKKSKFLKKFLIDNINVFLEIFPGSVKLHIMAAFIYFSIFKNSFKSLYELSFTKSKKSSLQDKYECFVLSSQVIAYFQSRASQGMSNQPMQFEKASKGGDEKKKKIGEFNAASFEVESEIKSVIEFEKINITFQKMIEMTSILTRKFWQEILKKNIDVEKVFSLGAHIYKNFVEIKKQYKHLMQLNNNYLEVAYLYKLFVSLILNFEIEVEDAKLEIVKIMQSKSMKKHNLKAEYKSIQLLEENGMIIISGSTSNFARILAMNNKAERTFGYGTNELMGQRLHRLMPRLFSDNHEELILNFINGNRRINKENHNFVWGKHKNNFIIPLIMEINAYVNFEFNFCFIAFLKRSVLLEFKPMRELLEYSDIFVMQISANGIIQDMTSNMQDYLNFPIQALTKDISVELFFKGLFDDELEQVYQNGRKCEFDPGVIKRILESEDIDARGDNDSEVGGANYAMSEKKCVAVVWLRNYDYTDQDVKLTYREVWFVLTEDDTNFLETRNNTTEGMTNMDGGEGGVKVNVTYTDDREEICSIASMSSLANYDKNRKNIMAKLSEIKTQTIDDQKPRQIDLLQKAIILVFLAVISIAILLLAVSSDRNSQFFANLDIIHQSKNGAILFAEIRLLLSSVVHFKNSRFNYNSDPSLMQLPQEILATATLDIEELRKIQSYMNFVEFSYSAETLVKKKSLITDYLQIRSNKIIETQANDISMIQGIQEFLDVANDVTAATKFSDIVFNTSILNYDNTNSSQYQGQQIGQTAINFYQLLKNGHGSLGNYLLQMSERYIADAIYQANNNSSLVLILTIVSIAITLMTALVILPILHKIERSKEKVLMIYTELKKDQIESLNRNIKIFFMKLQTGASQPNGSMSYQTSTRQFSNKLVTRKFTMNPNAKSGASGMDEFGFMARGSSIANMEMMSGGNDLLDIPTEHSSKFRVNSGGAQRGKIGSMNQGNDPFAALFNPLGNDGNVIGGSSALIGTGDEDPSGKSRGKKKKSVSIFRQLGNENAKKRSSRAHMSKNESEYTDEEAENRGGLQKRKAFGNRGEEEENEREESEENLSENAEEDKRAQILMSKEEAENALFKRLFQNKIKQMTCVKQVKYYALVACISLVMCGYFTLSYFMVTQIFQDSESSLNIYKLAGNRGPYLDTLLSFFLETQIRNQETFVQPLDDQYDEKGNLIKFNSLDYYYNLTQDNANAYGGLRRSTPGIISGSSSFIEGLESQNMCEWLIDTEYVKDYNAKLINASPNVKITPVERVYVVDECKNTANRLLQLGLQQTTNNILQNVLQGTLQFREGPVTGGLLKQDKEYQLVLIILVKLRYLNRMDRKLLLSIKDSILSYFDKQQSNYQIVFSVFIAMIFIAMVVLSYNGVEYLFKNLIAIKFILNFIPGQWLIENNAAEDLKYVEF